MKIYENLLHFMKVFKKSYQCFFLFFNRHSLAATLVPYPSVRSQMGRDFRKNSPNNFVSFLAHEHFLISPLAQPHLQYQIENEKKKNKKMKL